MLFFIEKRVNLENTTLWPLDGAVNKSSIFFDHQLPLVAIIQYFHFVLKGKISTKPEVLADQ